MVSINLPDSELNEVLSKAVMDALSEEARGELIQKAIEYLIQTRRDQYGRASSGAKSPIMEAFNRSIEQLAEKLVFEMVEESTVKDAIREAVSELIEAFPAISSEYNLRPKVAELIVDHFREERNR